jgi:hypothetical protein
MSTDSKKKTMKPKKGKNSKNPKTSPSAYPLNTAKQRARARNRKRAKEKLLKEKEAK